MPTPPLSDETVTKTFELYQQLGGRTSQIVKELGLSETTIRRHVRTYESRRLQAQRPEITFPELAHEDDDESIEELIELQTKRYLAKRRAADSRKNMVFSLTKPGPFVLAAVGDPHADDPGCAWPQLRADIELMGSHPHVYAVHLGDFLNQWQGRLAMKYLPEQDVSQKRAWKLVEWILEESQPFLCLLGNHDFWCRNSGTSPFKWLQQKTAAPIVDWSAQFILRTAEGRDYAVDAGHSFPGSSIHNPAHHLMRRSKETGYAADIYLAAHRHNWVIAHCEHEHNQKTAIMAMARGYKEMDSFANQLGYGHQLKGSSIGVVVDPERDILTAFPSIQQAAHYVDALRK